MRLTATLFVLFLAGCSSRAPIAPTLAEQPDGDTFVLHSAADERLPAPASPDVAAVGLETLAPAAEPATSPDHRDSDPASTWNALTTELAAGKRHPPTHFARCYALTHVAIYDALLAGRDARRGSLPDDAIAAGAASVVLGYLFPESSARIEAVASAQARLGPGRPHRLLGWILGRAVGALVVEHARRDGSDAVFTGTIPVGPGTWAGTNPVTPMCGSWRCWFIASGEQFQPEPPFAYGSPEDLSEVQEVLDVSLARTPEQIAIVHKWADRSPPAIWNELLLTRVESRRLSSLASARAFAYLNTAMFDAFVSCWRTKFTYWTARPFHRIPGLETVIATPNFPSYTSGHSTISAAAAVVMGELFPRERSFFLEQAEEAAMSRLWGGIHYRRDNEQGAAVGLEVGHRVVSRMRGFIRLAVRS